MSRTTTTALAALGLAALAAAPAGATGMPPAGAPELVPGNPTCQDLDGSWRQAKIDPVPQGTSGIPEGGGIAGTLFASGPRVAFELTSGRVAAVIVKGGPHADVYRYAAGSTADSGLVTPDNRNGRAAGLSHVDFCVGPERDDEDCDEDASSRTRTPATPVHGAPKDDDDECAGPVDPGPVDPGPVDPGPVDPGPVDPGPVTPGPIDPGPTTPTTPITPTTPSSPTTPTVLTNADGTVTTTVAGGAATVAGTSLGAGAAATSVTSGRARVSVPRGCVRSAVAVTITGRAMRSIAFAVNGRRVRTVSVRAAQTAVTARLPRRDGAVQRITARVTFTAASQTRARTLRVTAFGCSAAVVRPTFTG